MSVVSPSAVSLARVKATVRALLPLFVTLSCLVFAIVATPAAAVGDPITPTAPPYGGSNHTGNGTVTLYDAGDAVFDGAADVESAIGNGTLDQPDRMVVNDTLVASLDSERLAGAMATHNGSTTERFLAALDGDADFRFLGTYPRPNSLRLFATVGPENVTVSRNGTTVFVLVDTGDLQFRRPSGDGRTYSVDSFYETRITVSFGFGLPAPRDVQRGAEPAGPVVEFWSEEYLPGTPTPTPHSTPTGNGTVTLYDADSKTFAGAAAVDLAVRDGRLDEPGTMTVGETLVVAVESERLTAAMDDRSGPTTQRFLAALDGETDLYVVQTMPTPMVTRTYARLGPRNVTAYRNGTTVYAVVDTGELAFVKRGDEDTLRQESFDDEQFAVDFGFDLYEPRWKPPEPEGPGGPTFSISGEQPFTATPADGPATTTPEAVTGTPRAATETTAGRQSPAVTASATRSNAETPTTSSGSGPGFTVRVFLVAFLVFLATTGRRD